MTDQTVMTLRFQSVFFCSHGSKRRISAFALWSEQNSFFIPLVTTKTWLELEPMLVISRTLVSLEKQNSFVCTNSCQFGYQNHFWGAGLYKASRNWSRLTTRGGEGTPLYKPYYFVVEICIRKTETITTFPFKLPMQVHLGCMSLSWHSEQKFYQGKSWVNSL